ncbi:MAG TPA: PIN domain-containing protein [Polyangia bacterium]|nr:PIN domain-containing protein [Polyangia bacterium]
MIAVDTSVWVEFFRGRQPLTDRVSDVLERDQVALPVPVRIEILSGARKTERPRLARLLSALPLLLPSDATWRRIEEWVATGAGAGQRFGVADLLVAAIASENNCAIWSLDPDFARMARLGLVSLADPAG